MIMRFQFYPWSQAALAKDVAKELGLPVDTPKSLAEGTMDRFLAWHAKNV